MVEAEAGVMGRMSGCTECVGDEIISGCMA
eukprot:COSAG06_NODE_11992_length_1438_cov_1.356236_2_plen_29_part_01